MRAYELLEYNQQSLLNIFGDKLMAKWESEQYPFLDEIGEQTPEAFFKWLEQFDPTQNKKYMTWIVNRYAGRKGGIERLEDIHRTQEALDAYERLSRKKQLKPEHKDINQIKTLHDLEDITDQYQEKPVQSKKEKDKSIEQEFYDTKQAELVFNNDTYKVVIPHSHKASCYFGKSTKWCTAGKQAESTFKQYVEKGPLYIILHKPTNSRWQWHFGHWQYMDERDRRFDMDEFIKDHKPAVNAIIKHVGGLEEATIKDPITWFKYIKNPSEKIQQEALEYSINLFKYIKNPSKQIQLFTIEKNPEIATEYIKNPSKEIQMAAINRAYGTQTSRVLGNIKNPYKEVQWAAIKKDGDSIEFVKNPSESMKRMAVQNYGAAIEHIDNPSEELQLLAVRGWGPSIMYIKNPSEQIQREAVKNDSDELAIKSIKNPSREVQLLAIKHSRQGKAIRHIKNPSEEIQMSAIKINPDMLKYIKNPSEDAQLAAIQKKVITIRHIKNPSEQVQLAAIKQNPEAIKHIKNPSSKIVRYAKAQKTKT